MCVDPCVHSVEGGLELEAAYISLFRSCEVDEELLVGFLGRQVCIPGLGFVP